MTHRTDKELLADLKNICTAVHRQNLQDPTAWAEFMAAVMEIEEQNPRLKSMRYVTEQLSSDFVERLRRHHKPIRYSQPEYHDLLTKIVLLHQRPVLAIVSVDGAFNCPDPTEILEEQIRFAEVAMGAKFSMVVPKEEKQKRLDRGLELMRENGGRAANEDLFRAQFEGLSEKAEKLRERKLSLEQIVEFTADELFAALLNRNIRVKSEPECRAAIDYVLAICEDAEFTAVALINSACVSPNPVEDLMATKLAATNAVRERDRIPGAN